MCQDKIECALLELEKYKEENSSGKEDWTVRITKMVLKVMKEDAIQNKPFSERTIRAFKDIAVVSVRNYEQTGLGDAIYALSSCLHANIPNYAEYKPLGMEFGKEYPF